MNPYLLNPISCLPFECLFCVKVLLLLDFIVLSHSVEYPQLFADFELCPHFYLRVLLHQLPHLFVQPAMGRMRVGCWLDLPYWFWDTSLLYVSTRKDGRVEGQDMPFDRVPLKILLLPNEWYQLIERLAYYTELKLDCTVPG